MKFLDRRPLGRSVASACISLFVVMGVSLMAQEDDKGRRGPALGSVFSPEYCFDGERLLAAHGKVAYLSEVATGREIQHFKGHAEVIRAVALSPDGKQALTGGGREDDLGSFSTDNSARLWDLATGEEVRSFEGHKGFVHTARFSPDGRRVLTAARDSTARVWDTDSGQQIFVLTGISYLPLRGGSAVSFSPDGSRILGLIAGGHRVKLWDAGTGEELLAIERDEKFFESAEFSPDGRTVVTASSSGTARTWDAETGRQVQAFAGHTSYVHHATFTGDGQRIVTASADGTVRLWDASTGKEIKRFATPGPARQVFAGPRGDRVLASWDAGPDGPRRRGVTLWDTESGQELMRTDDSEPGEIVGLGPDGRNIPIVKDGVCVALRDATTGRVIRKSK